MITKELYLYDDNPDVRLTTYCLDSPELMAMGPRPAVLVLPGGGYFSCSDREAEPVALAFAAMGYHAFVLRYSVYDPKRSAFPDITKDIPLKRACQHPRPVREVGMAMRLIRDHAEAWKVDADRIAVCGFSAGGHNAAMYGAYWNTDLVTEGKFDPIRPAALILGYPLTDYVLMRDLLKNASPMDQTFFRQSNRAFLGGREDDAKFDEVSPARHVTKDFPPTFLFATTTDAMVPPQHSLALAMALQNAKIPYELHLYEGGPHGLSLADQASATSEWETEPRVASWIQDAKTWLLKRFAIRLPKEPAWIAMTQGEKQ